MERLPLKRRRRCLPVPKMRSADARQGHYDETGGVFTQDTLGAGVVPTSKRAKRIQAEKLKAFAAPGELLIIIESSNIIQLCDFD